jgi:hypothetical protein
MRVNQQKGKNEIQITVKESAWNSMVDSTASETDGKEEQMVQRQ